MSGVRELRLTLRVQPWCLAGPTFRRGGAHASAGRLEACRDARLPGVGRTWHHGRMADTVQTKLGDVQRTLFFPLLARARETERGHPLLRDPKAAELVRAIDFDTATYDESFMSFVMLIRTMILDWWVSQFLAAHPAGTVVELGTGLNTRFERTDNGSVHWIDLDLPDTIELRRRFFADTTRRRMIPASLTDEDWLSQVE